MTVLKLSRRNLAWAVVFWTVLLAFTFMALISAVPGLISFLFAPRLNMEAALIAAQNEKWQESRQTCFDQTRGYVNSQIMEASLYEGRFTQHGFTYFSFMPQQLVKTNVYQETTRTIEGSMGLGTIASGKFESYYAIALVDGAWLPVKYSEPSQIEGKARFAGVLLPSRLEGKRILEQMGIASELPELPYELDMTRRFLIILISQCLLAGILSFASVWVSKKVLNQIENKQSRPVYRGIAAYKVTEEQMDEMLKSAVKTKGHYIAQWLVLTPLLFTSLVKLNGHHPKAREWM